MYHGPMTLDVPPGKRERTRRDLIEAADRVFRRRGVDGAIVRHVTEAAGVAHGTFYNYFDSMDELVEAMVRNHLVTVADRVETMRRQIRRGDLALAVGGRTLFRAIASSTARPWLIQRPQALAHVLSETIHPFARQDITRLASAGKVRLPVPVETWLATMNWTMIGLLLEAEQAVSAKRAEDAFISMVLASLSVRTAAIARLVSESRDLLEMDE